MEKQPKVKISYHKSSLDGNYIMDIQGEYVNVELNNRFFTKNLKIDINDFIDFVTEHFNGFLETEFQGRIAFKREEDVKKAVEYVESILLMERLRKC